MTWGKKKKKPNKSGDGDFTKGSKASFRVFPEEKAGR